VLGIVDSLGIHGVALTAMRYYVGILAATILFIATNAGLIGISRLSWSLAEHRQLPARSRRCTRPTARRRSRSSSTRSSRRSS
jgi:APA family basic amino acid/polyamine antiporter